MHFVLECAAAAVHCSRHSAASPRATWQLPLPCNARGEFRLHSGISCLWNRSRSELAPCVSSDLMPGLGRDLLHVLVVLIALSMVGAAGAENAPRQNSAPVTADDSTGTVAAAPSGPVTAPVWQVGNEWKYSYKGPSDSGTYVWSVNRIESVDGSPHYVIKSGAREILFRVSDLAFSLERINGVVVSRESPSRLSYVWPLTVGKTWEQSTVREGPVDRQTVTRDSLYTVVAEETITVPAGTFRTFKIVWRHKHTRALINELWYAPDVKQLVKIRESLWNGIGERELLGFMVKQTPSAAPPTEPEVIVPSATNALPPAKPTIRRGIVRLAGNELVYPRTAIRAGIDKGKVVARVMIDESGTVYDVVIVSAEPPDHFDEAVIDALKQWKFQGEGTKYIGEVQISFALKDEPRPDAGDLTPTIEALVRKYEAAQPAAPVPDAERAQLARDIIETAGMREMLSLAFSPDQFKENFGTRATISKMPPKLGDAMRDTAIASFRSARILASFERGLSETLDSAALRAGLEWERSELGRTINRFALEAAKPELRAARKEFVERFIRNGGATNDARARACAQKDILDNSTDAMLPLLEAFGAAGGMAAVAQQGQSLDFDAIQRLATALRPILRDMARQTLLAGCLFSFRRLGDAEFEKWLEFLRTDLGGRYARGVVTAQREALLEVAEVFTRTLVDVARQLKGAGES